MNKNSHPAKTNSQSKEVLAFYIGIDLGDKYSDVCVFDAGSGAATDFSAKWASVFERVKGPSLLAPNGSRSRY
jgi:hypothetical protein